ncbi:pol polyprotein [Lasius niger]|uniref:RNA-directed DNA polymerase n=1 Tax=Lasius niger TaxID=67767 RepID=A0A0J7K6P0_LASNI|nr:pol polyprotein [Lasius niger]
MVNFCNRFLKGIASIQALLQNAIAGHKRNNAPVTWTTELKQSFQQVKEHFARSTLLAFPDSKAILSLQTDASDKAIGAVLQQNSNEISQPLSFFSKKLTPAQTRYSAYDRELLAIYAAIKHFRFMIEGRNFHIITDYKPLVYAFKKKADQMSSRQTRQLLFISEFSTDIRHITGTENIVADALSRIDTIVMPTSIDMQEIAELQSTDEELQQLKLSTSTSLKLKKFTLSETAATIYCDTSGKDIRPYIPKLLRRRAFDMVHQMAHPSGRATHRQVAQKFVWPSMAKDIKEWARTCLACQRSKIHRHNHTLPTKIPVPDSRFEHIHIDIVGPLPPSKEYRYLLTMIDRFTRWPEAVPLQDCTANTVAKAFFTHWVARFGAPHLITTDQGSQFEAQLFDAITQLVGAKRCRTTTYHPEANGIIERWHRTLKSALMCHNESQWTETLPVVLLGLRTCYKENLDTSAAELVYGTTLKVPGEFFSQEEMPNNPRIFVEDFRAIMQKLQPRPTTHHIKPKLFFHKDLHNCSHVFLKVEGTRRPLDQPYTGPHKIIKRISDKVFNIEVNGRSINVTTDRLKPAYIVIQDSENAPSDSSPIPSTSSNVQAGTELKTYSGPATKRKMVHFVD